MPMPCMDNELCHKNRARVRFTPLLDVSAIYATDRQDERGKYNHRGRVGRKSLIPEAYRHPRRFRDVDVDYMSLSTNNPASGRDLDEARATQIVNSSVRYSFRFGQPNQ